LAGGVCRYCVAAFEDAEGAALFQLESETVEALAFCAEQAVRAGAQIAAAFFQTQAQGGNLHTKIERDDAHVRGGEAAARVTNICAEAVSQAGGEFIRSLALLTQEVEWAAEASARGIFVNAAAEDENAIANLLDEGAAEVGDVLGEFAAGLHD